MRRGSGGYGRTKFGLAPLEAPYVRNRSSDNPRSQRHILTTSSLSIVRFTRLYLDKMSYIARRGLSTLIPPKIASPNAIGAAKDAARMERVVNFYARLPRGSAPDVKPTGLIGRYQARYFGKNPSAAPLAHAIGGILLIGYSMEYYFHLRHHKNHPH
ncbi:putative mitochondrial F1F0 ATP synthase subunit F [Aspergillus lentulus]|uniref:Mitochondrial F1F0 ATP synthase subunit F n=3 Tax=Aspergillus subgen. Fumigati TaxID=2720872 RepID=A0AAN5YW25_ASPLE|nr:putative mitochondrial F1F0 ATP synthase subunit F [Aspergillus lentulus]KAF4158132.1 hypothetical protein CNMCM6069_004551 [Aspergillus lentulus]KAF4165284.1 hypothetical protein CNMCM6936_007986 [Aspergillus lentulus]KAF4176399.1 hypothetical protein CNMCM8060_006388 [Aspergillus lentulus]KAF4184543.1 hypothetical protein CNMCM7927_007803 [Aspergillus lentulus]KAF4194547.1 hypothetical protein CNMCM8694_007355 [Aspergillus lentulus]